MAKLYELAKLIRSKNAGPFIITIDILFDNSETYQKVLNSHALTPENFAGLYHMPADKVNMYPLQGANAIKFSYPRKYPSGDFMDDDLYGCQEHRPIVNLDIAI